MLNLSFVLSIFFLPCYPDKLCGRFNFDRGLYNLVMLTQKDKSENKYFHITIRINHGQLQNNINKNNMSMDKVHMEREISRMSWRFEA